MGETIRIMKDTERIFLLISLSRKEGLSYPKGALHIKPSKKSQKWFTDRLHEIILTKGKALLQQELIEKLLQPCGFKGGALPM